MKIAVLSLAEGAGTVGQDFQVPPPLINMSCENKIPYIQAPALRTLRNQDGISNPICTTNLSLQCIT